ncbi:MAG TPA: hypothetical protein VN026_17930 [Bacteroidia bacterium]|jgi:hypothetical protein|nr:hypothetical protein [Bacteroidia bacterium]
MENNYQEKILGMYHGFEAVKDCFAISRIQSEIIALSKIAVFNEKPRKELQKRYNELNEILGKYSDVVDKIEL